ncbi:hypothetical protein [Pseudomonas serbica]|uniref:hypothetical protein n=1 Tax=Pseudomonas serbica TaxID=2965074 RepID=UPI00237AE8E4|nr:hypothetical protein [Pseudomonas serbica]
MRTNFEIPELLGILKSSNKPLSADQIAKKADTLRNRVTPFLKKMVTTGQVIEVREADQPILFKISETAANELITPISTKPSKPAAKSATKPSTKTATKAATKPAAKAPKATTASAQKPGRKPAAKAESNVHQFERPADKTPSTAAAPTTSANVTPIKAAVVEGGDLKMAVLRMLVDADLRKVDLQDALGPVDDVLEELKKEQLIEQQHIIDSYVYNLADKAFVVYPELKDKPAPVAAVAPVVAVVEPQKATQAPTTPAPATKPAAKPAGRKPAAAAPTPAAPAATVPAAPASKEPTLPPVFGEISQEISRVVEQIFKDRLDGLVEELRVKSEEQEAHRQAVAEVSEGILVCTQAFQSAIDALSGLAAKLTKLN